MQLIVLHVSTLFKMLSMMLFPQILLVDKWRGRESAGKKLF